jgi:hypothetical protein
MAGGQGGLLGGPTRASKKSLNFPKYCGPMLETRAELCLQISMPRDDGAFCILAPENSSTTNLYSRGLGFSRGQILNTRKRMLELRPG